MSKSWLSLELCEQSSAWAGSRSQRGSLRRGRQVRERRTDRSRSGFASVSELDEGKQGLIGGSERP